MFEKLLLAATITFSLNLFLGLSSQSTQQPTVAAQSTTAQLTILHSTRPLVVYLAKARHDRPFLRNLVQ